MRSPTGTFWRWIKSKAIVQGRASNAYKRIAVTVLKDGDPAGETSAQTYVVCERVEPNPLPHPEYLARIISGAEWIKAPADYIAELGKIDVKG